MYLRFLQLKRSGNVKLRNKMKKGKAGWFVVSMCFFGAGLVFMGNPSSVHADKTDGNNPQTESAAEQSSNDKVVPEQPVNNALVNDGQQDNQQLNNVKQGALQTENKSNNQAIFQATAQDDMNNADVQKQDLVHSQTVMGKNYSVPSTQSSAVQADPSVSQTSVSQTSVDPYDDITNSAKSDPTDSATWYITDQNVMHIQKGVLNGGVVDEDVNPTFGKHDISGVSSIIIDSPDVSLGEDASGVFSSFYALENIEGLDKITTDKTINMSYLFRMDLALKGMDLSKFDTTKVTDMSHMFDSTFSLKELNLSSFDTSNVTDMSYMFNEMVDEVNPDEDNNPTSGITELNLSNFDIKNVTNMAYMFFKDRFLNSIDMPSKGKATLKEAVGIFGQCSKLASIDVSNLDMSGVDGYGVTGMFGEDESLQRIKVDGSSVLEGSDLPEITKTSVYTGKWLGDDEKDKSVYDSSELMKLYPAPATGSSENEITYTWQKNISKPTDVTLKTTLGDKIIKNVTGPLDSDIEIDSPEVAGYTAAPAKVKVHIDENGVVTLPNTGDYDVTYSLKKPSGGSSHHSDSDKNTNSVEQLNQTVMTYHNQGNIGLYTMDGQEITNRELYPGSDWFSNEVVTHNNVKYYRVATNELVKAEDALIYVDHADTIVTKDGAPKSLSNEHSQNVSDRKLMSNTAWKTDRYAFFNGTKFYRVATNEWVNAEDVQDNL